jgi:hypothetical protein
MRTIYSMLWVSGVLWILLAIGCSTNDLVYSGTIKVSEGKNVIETNKYNWAGINRVWYYRPSNSGDSLRLIMVPMEWDETVKTTLTHGYLMPMKTGC